MDALLRISVVDPDDDYLGLEIHAASQRFAGTARIYAGHGQLSELASRLEGFPVSPQDQREYEFGSKAAGTAGGYVALRFHCERASGPAAVSVTVEDDEPWHGAAAASFRFFVYPADIDKFVLRIRAVERAQSGETVLLGTKEAP